MRATCAAINTQLGGWVLHSCLQAAPALAGAPRPVPKELIPVLTIASACILPPLMQAAAASLANALLPGPVAEVVLIVPGGCGSEAANSGLGIAVQLIASWFGWLAGEDTLIGRGALLAWALGSQGAWVALGAALVLWGHWVPWAAAGAWAAAATGAGGGNGVSISLPGLASSSSATAGGLTQSQAGLLPPSTKQSDSTHTAGQQQQSQGPGQASVNDEEEGAALDSIDEGGPVGEGRAWVSVGNGQTILLSPSDLAREVPFGVPVPGSLRVLPSPQNQQPISSSRSKVSRSNSSSTSGTSGTRVSNSQGSETGGGSGSGSGDDSALEYEAGNTSTRQWSRSSDEAPQVQLRAPRSLGELVHQVWAKLASWAASNPPLAACVAGR